MKNGELFWEKCCLISYCTYLKTFIEVVITEKYQFPIGILKQLKLNLKEYAVYKRDMREYNIQNNIPLKGIILRKLIFPIVSFGVKIARLSNHHTLEIIGDKRTFSERPCIFVVTHIGKFDIERVFEACKTSCWIFNGDPETVYRNFDGFSLAMSGVILIDTEFKTDRKVALETAVKLLKSKGNLMFFPEGIWNVEPSIPVLHLFPGIVEIAFRTSADIIPVAIEQYGNHFQINIGRNIRIEELRRISDSPNTVLKFLRDEMATLKWEIFERNPDERSNMTNVAGIQQKRIYDKLHEWTDKNGVPYYTEKILKSKQYKVKDETTYSEAFAHLNELTTNLQNAFLFNIRLK